MTFDEIVTEVTSALNLTSTVATTRIGRIVNRYYKRVTTAVGIPEGTRITLTLSATATIGSQEVTFASVEKIHRVWYLSGTTKVFLREVTSDEIRDLTDVESSDTPTMWATLRHTDNDVVIILNTTPATALAMKADGVATVGTLSGVAVPQFPESFHDVLVYGPLKEEQKKLGHKEEADESKQEFNARLSDLRMWFAKSKYKQIQQHRNPAATHVDRDGTQ
jgi:hypothetical protein